MIALALFTALAWQSAAVRLGSQQWDFALADGSGLPVTRAWIQNQLTGCGKDAAACEAGFAAVCALEASQMPKECFAHCDGYRADGTPDPAFRAIACQPVPRMPQ